MLRFHQAFLGTALLTFAAALLAGCTQQDVAQDDAPDPAQVQQEAPPVADEDNQQPQDEMAELDPEVQEALAALPPADREAALEQKICPVSGQPLGSMGTPRKVTVQGREVFTCCEGCDDELRENPEEYLAKLPAE